MWIGNGWFKYIKWWFFYVFLKNLYFLLVRLEIGVKELIFNLLEIFWFYIDGEFGVIDV